MTAIRHQMVAGWVGRPGECGVECECGVIFDGFDSRADAAAVLDRHIADTSKARFTRGERAVIAAAAVFAVGVGMYTGALIWAHDRLEYQEQVWLGVCVLALGAWLVMTASLVRRRKRKP